MSEQVKTATVAAKTSFLSRFQPWQALFTLLSAAFTVYGFSDYKALVFYGMIIVCLGFVMVSSHKNKEAMKEVVIPFVVERALEAIEGYVKTNSVEEPEIVLPVEPEPEPELEIVKVFEPENETFSELDELTREELMERLEAMG